MCVHPCYRNKLAWSRESSCQEKSLKEKLGVAEQHLGERDRTGDGEDFSLSLVSSTAIDSRIYFPCTHVK